MSNWRRWQHYLGAAIAVVGIGLGIPTAVVLGNHRLHAYQRVVMPGSADLRLAAATKYTVYYESRSVVGGRRFDTGPLGDLTCGLQDVSGETTVPLNAIGFSSTYSFGTSYVGAAIYDFRSNGAGRYVLSCDHAGGDIALALADRSLAAPIFAGLTFTLGSIGAAAGIYSIYYVRRRSWRRRNLVPYPAGGLPPGMVPYGSAALPPVTADDLTALSTAGRLAVPAVVAAWLALSAGLYALIR
jgi:hypothetical protein